MKKHGLLRTEKTQRSYEDAISSGILEQGCILCRKESVTEFTYWRIVTNDFPYDRIATTHDMLVTKRCVAESDLSTEEIAEFYTLKQQRLGEMYNIILEALPHRKSIPPHAHHHLIVEQDFTDTSA